MSNMSTLFPHITDAVLVFYWDRCHGMDFVNHAFMTPEQIAHIKFPVYSIDEVLTPTEAGIIAGMTDTSEDRIDAMSEWVYEALCEKLTQ